MTEMCSKTFGGLTIDEMLDGRSVRFGFDRWCVDDPFGELRSMGVPLIGEHPGTVRQEARRIGGKNQNAAPEEHTDSSPVDPDLDLGRRLFVGYGVARDLCGAAGHLAIASLGGCGDADCWLELFRDLPPMERWWDYDGESGGRMHDDGRWPYGDDDYEFEPYRCQLPELRILEDIIGMGVRGPVHMSGYEGGYMNTTFLMLPEDCSNDDEEPVTDYMLEPMPDFCFLPTGFEMMYSRDSGLWEDDAVGAGYSLKMNRPLYETTIKRILRICIRSVLDDIDNGAAL